MKKILVMVAAFAICASVVAGEDLRRSRNLSKTQPKADYIFITDSDGRWNLWESKAVVFANLYAATNALDVRIDDADSQAVATLTYIYSYPDLTAVTNFLTNTVSVASIDAASASKSGYRLFRIWVSTSDTGASTTNNIEALTLSTGSQLEEVTAGADYWYISATGGTAVATINATAAGTNYLMVSDGAAISSVAITFE